MLDLLTQQITRLIYVPEEGMVHPGITPDWVLLVLFAMSLIVIRSLLLKRATAGNAVGISFPQLPGISRYLAVVLTRPWLLVAARLFAVAVFLLVIYAGLFGTQVPERNIATVLTWTVWWSAVIMSVFFVGSAWCAICPWDALSSWMVRRKLWRRGSDSTSLNLRVPKIFRSVWPALLMFVGLTWLELGVGVTTNPYATALLALLMVVLASVSLAFYERKAFCRYFCAVGRTIGAYSSVSPVALRPVNEAICADCKTLECYHGTTEVEPCPTHLVMGRITQNTYCTSCGACTISCPKQNVNWRLRPVGEEIVHASRPHWDEAWFILGLLSLTVFHGMTMMPYWEGWMRRLAYVIGDSGSLLGSFSIGMSVSMLIPIVAYVAVVKLTQWVTRSDLEFRRLFSTLAFSLLPLAFSYHIAHNLTHLVRESQGFWSVVMNPLGVGTLPLTMHETHMRHMNPMLPDNMVFALQGMLVIFGFWLALKIAKQRVTASVGGGISGFMPMLIFISMVSLTNLWLLMQPMIMRM